ncbi:MAG: hypothetical protein OMM_03148 [Candidatus Magnetoglobus multicellularis str. Araruama]|uniref:TIR domain-containing protein n=1 Tax=Candidatus Magnetoglobus multicellularis str. Araruama TaxID=890399 RepID=A0A1V1P6Z7_9BACT|nr:MAG: hypothetical protein OMM_03148 [Candidatus Magnetoglobus multicellularis str. Araruama]
MDENLCFVIMPFSEDIEEVYEIIKETVDRTGFKCIRADKIPGGGNILRDIIVYIRKSRLIIADLTKTNPNVMYELGLAHALNNNVIMLAQDIVGDLPFDLKNYKVIRYKMDFKGSRQLMNQIIDTVNSIDEWSKNASSPVQDFLDDKDLPVDGAKYLEIKKLLDEKDKKIKEYETKINEMDRLIDKLLGTKVGLSSEEKLKKVIDDVEIEGELTVDVQGNADIEKVNNSSGRKRIKFRKL